MKNIGHLQLYVKLVAYTFHFLPIYVIICFPNDVHIHELYCVLTTFGNLTYIYNLYNNTLDYS